MLQEEAMLIKERLNNDDLATFTASNGWLEKFKITYGLRETRIAGEADDVPRSTIQSWIERLPELIAGYQLNPIHAGGGADSATLLQFLLSIF